MEVTTLDYEALRAGFEAAIPYNRHVGLEVGEIGRASCRERVWTVV